MTEVEFHNPNWINAIWAVVALAVLFVWVEIRRANASSPFVSEEMQRRLARTTSLASRIVSHFFLILALVCFVFAMMRPQFGYKEKKVPHLGAQVMICLDVSKSMLAEDATPSRLERAKSELEVLLNYLKDDQVGLVAFAGSANVLCPMTTDFGYLKMLLRETTTTSVGRGGTLLENPIRKALSGFSDASDMSKVIILITDGEDNGSKPLDAAKLAAERGIKIITIGIGLEGGSRIEITDPQTGLKSYIRDSNGNEVVSKLDIDMLKKIASTTSGAFIPARVGSLDVESIHRDLIQPMTRATGETKHIIKNEVYQWPLVGGVLMIIVSVMTSNTLAFSRTPFTDWLLSRSTARLLPVLFLLFVGQNLSAQQNQHAGHTHQNSGETKKDAGDEGKDSNEGLGGEFSSRGGEENIPEDPVECYNRSVDLLVSNTSFAETLLEEARKNAGDNAHLRFCSSFNLGWVKVNQANEQLEQNPKEALKHLQSAADWFREAIRLRPKYKEARENLEIVLRRIAELNDSLNKSDPQTFEKQLDEIIERQTTMMNTCRELLQRSRLEGLDELSHDLQRTFRLTSVDQRLLNSDLSEIIRRATQLIEEFEKKKKADPQQAGDPRTQLRMSQITQALVYADRAAQKLGQARSQLRFKRAERASLRAASGLDELKRARDQLRNPGEILRQIIADSQLLHKQTQALVAGENSLAAFLGTQLELPAWLNSEYLLQFQTTQLERTDELFKVLSRIAESQASKDPDAASDPSKSAKERLLAKTISRATKLLKLAMADFRRSSSQLSSQNPRLAEPKQVSAIGYLKEAYELFADLKGLLELAYHEQVQLNQDFDSAQKLSGDVLKTVLDDFGKRLNKNNDRIERIVDNIKKNIEEKKAGDQGNVNSNGNANNIASDQELQRLIMAEALAEKLSMDSKQLETALEQLVPAEDVQWSTLLEQGESVEKQLAELRRIFFSIVEHLRETAGRQDNLNGDSEKALQIAERKKIQSDAGDANVFTSLAPLTSRQRELSNVSKQIGLGLKQTADQMAGQIQPGVQQPQNAKDTLQKYSSAAKLVEEGQGLMEEAATELENKKLESETVRVMQQEALDKLIEALRLLTPPEDQQDENEEEQNKKQQPQNSNPSPSILQKLRDQEAQRRNQNNRGKYQERVEKDW